MRATLAGFTIDGFAYIALHAPEQSSATEIRPNPLVCAAYSLVTALQTSMVMMKDISLQ